MEFKLEFAGGLEQLVVGERRNLLISFSEPSSEVRLFHIVSFVARRLLRAKPELFAVPYTPEDPAVYEQQQQRQKELRTEEATQNTVSKENNDTTAIYSTADLLQGCMAVRGGVLALVNEVDCEVLNGADTPVKPSDTLTFISTLHGG